MQATNHEIRIFLSAIYLSFYSLFTIYQAYTHADFSMVAFTVFVYIGSFCLIYCIKQLQDSPPTDTSLRKPVFVFALAVSASSFLFFFYFVRPSCKSETPPTELYPPSQVEHA
ncbi:hypothetical protein J1N35_023398 [Gossypium stocksii]|uniref:Uncharacterized protein n=1 Tax=Gossypium stocksii TaxID=47602 RepID=A0A9D3VJZ0_9ROSI|nr:hypothetical protein J1N35_023398 [Gossypium stocksii]